MWLIPGKTKVQVELFKGVRLTDLFVGFISIAMIVLVLTSTIPGRLYIAIGLVMIAVALLVRIDDEPNYLLIPHILHHVGYCRSYQRTYSDRELLRKNAKGERAAAFDGLFRDEQEAKETDSERLARIKAERAERREDDRKLKDRSVSKEEKDAIWLKRANQSAAKKREKEKANLGAAHEMGDIMAFTGIKNGFIQYAGKYYGTAIEIPPVEFRFFSNMRRTNSIENGVGKVLRTLPPNYCANIVKIERAVNYEDYLDNEYEKLEILKGSYEKGFITEEELQARVEVLYDRINDLRELCSDRKVVMPFYYLVLFDSDRKQLTNATTNAVDSLRNAELDAHRLDTRELAIFLKYTNQLDFDESEIDRIAPADYAAWAMPQSVQMKYRTVVINDIITHNLRISNYPVVVGDAWMAGVMSMPATKVVIKCSPMDRAKSVRAIDFSLQELRAQYRATGVDSKRIELQEHIATLSNLLSMLQGDNETLLLANAYVTCYDIKQSVEQNPENSTLKRSSLANINNLKQVVRRLYNESNMRLNGLDFEQVPAFIGAQISAYDPMAKQGRGIPSNTIAAAYPWIYSCINDAKGIKLGTADGVPVFIDFFRRDSERVNSNMVIVGKSGSGKSYATKSLLTNLAADDSKIFILDPENEYAELAKNLHGKFINVGNAQFGRLNPFHIITALDDDEAGEGTASGSYATHLQFLEEFFRQILPDCEKDALEYLNSIIDRMYTNMGITGQTDLSQLRPEDYPVFDDLYDAILMEFQSTDNDYIRTMLRTLMNYIAKFSAGGRNANIWNGPSTVTTEENFTVFNFQSLLANRNGTIANAQMLLVLKYIDNEIIKNRDYNTKYGLNRKIVVVIDEAHVFIDTKFPVALDFMFQLAKRIRKYNGMQIVITQNIKDFVGSEEIARKSTAIINACQYSFIFSLAPNDMDDLCRLYEKAGGINENEQEQIISAPRGQAFTIMSPQSRSTFKVTVPEDVVAMFREPDYVSRYFNNPEGAAVWEEYIGASRAKHDAARTVRRISAAIEDEQKATRKHVTFVELTEEEAQAEQRKASRPRRPVTVEEFPEIPELPEDPAAFARQQAAAQQFAAAQAAAAAAAQPVLPVQPVVVQAPAASGETERMLAELLNKFSYGAMMDEIRRAVNAEIGKMPAVPAAPAEEEEEASGFALGSIFDSVPDTGFEDAADEDEDEDEDSGFDIMALLSMEAERLGDVSPIDMMETYGETVITISLEELMQYNRSH